ALLESIMRWPRIERAWLPAWLRDPQAVVGAIVTAVESAPSFGDVVVPPRAAVVADAESPVGDPGVEHDLLSDADAPAEVDADAQAAASVYGFEAFEPAPTEAVEPVAALDDPRRAPALV